MRPSLSLTTFILQDEDQFYGGREFYNKMSTMSDMTSRWMPTYEYIKRDNPPPFCTTTHTLVSHSSWQFASLNFPSQKIRCGNFLCIRPCQFSVRQWVIPIPHWKPEGIRGTTMTPCALAVRVYDRDCRQVVGPLRLQRHRDRHRIVSYQWKDIWDSTYCLWSQK